MLGLWRVRLAATRGRRWAAKRWEKHFGAPAFVVNWWTWRARRWLSPVVRLRCVIRCKNGLRFRLGSDPIGERVVADTFTQYQELYFPADVGDAARGRWILDVGAHHGVYAVGALAAYAGSRLIAVEPDPRSGAILRENLALNGMTERVEVVAAAISGSEGEGRLEMSDEGSWGNRLIDGQSGAPAVSVATRRLETVLGGRQPVIVKCNAEGGEFEVVRQMLALGLRPGWVLLFVHPDAGSMPDLLGSLESVGYEVTPTAGEPTHPRFVCRLKADGGGKARGK